MITLVIPLQIGITVGGVILFSANSEMLRDFFSFFKVVLWQGYLRPIDLREEVDNFGDVQLEEYGKLFNLTINLTMAFFFLNIFIVIIIEARGAATVSSLVKSK